MRIKPDILPIPIPSVTGRLEKASGGLNPWELFRNDVSGKRVLIMGLGVQGRGVGDAGIFAEAGSDVTVTDLKPAAELSASMKKLKKYPIEFVLGQHRERDFRETDLIIRNPDVLESSPFLAIARRHGIPILMDSSLFAKYCPVPIIGVTGTRGKTTTTMMIYEIFKKQWPGGVFLGGNVPGTATLRLLADVSWGPRVAWVVLELSSWELQGWHDAKISPHIGVFTNFSPDHLNRYASMTEYFQDKSAIFRYQKPGDSLVVNRESDWLRKHLQPADQVSRVWFSGKDFPADCTLKIPGEHNRANAAAALAVADLCGVPRQKSLPALCGFPGVPFRLELVRTLGTTAYINDTTATAPTATIAAIESMSTPTVLIAGGSSKRLDLLPLGSEIVDRMNDGKLVGVVWLYGSGTDELIQKITMKDPSFFSRYGERAAPAPVRDLAVAIGKARELAPPGGAVLMSPGCASFSMFRNEFDRGDQFNRIVRRLR